MTVSSLVAALAAVCAFAPRIAVIDAQQRPCGPDASSGSVAQKTSQCFEPNGSGKLDVEVSSALPTYPITSLRYALQVKGASQFSSTGQFMDAIGSERWVRTLDVPRTQGEHQVYELTMLVESRACQNNMTLLLEARPGATTPKWDVPGTQLSLMPSGCWRKIPDPAGILDLSLRSCDGPEAAIKAVVVTAQPDLSLASYVSNSIGAYTRSGAWRVNGRQSLPTQVGEGEVLELVQTVGSVETPIEKFFVASGADIVVITRYGRFTRAAGENWIVRSNARYRAGTK